MRKIKVILFDADGVLINGTRFSETLEKDLKVPKEKSLPFFTGKFMDCLVGKADLKQELAPHLQDWGWQGTTDEFLEYWFTSEHAINRELIEYVQKLKGSGIACYIATNQEQYRTQYIISEMVFGKVFDGIFSSAALGHLKPNEEFYTQLHAQLGDISLEEIVFVDDTRANVEAAERLGMKGIHFSTTEDFKEQMRKYLQER